jgi:thioesterase domain-containing protein
MLADEYVNLIIGLNKKKIQIIGYCISGLIAVEIARRLMERGLEIFDLVLIDSHPIQYQLEDELLMCRSCGKVLINILIEMDTKKRFPSNETSISILGC